MADNYYGNATAGSAASVSSNKPKIHVNTATPNFTSIPGSTLAHSDSCKIFVGGLSWQTNEESLRWHFEQYGPVISVEVMRDRNTGDPRGFAFVVFETTETVDLVMVDKDKHEINHKFVDVKRAQARGVAPPSIHEKQAAAAAAAAEAAAARGLSVDTTAAAGTTSNVTSSSSSPPPVSAHPHNNSHRNNNAQQPALTPEQLHCKIFVGGIPPQVDNDELYTIFSKYGTVIDAIVMMDPMNPMKSRCFGFVTFDPEQDGAHAAATAISQQPIQVHGRNVEIKLATPRAEQPSQQASNFRTNNHSHNNSTNNNNSQYHSNIPFVPPVAKNVGLRAGLGYGGGAGGMTHNPHANNSIYNGLAVAYGRNGWKAGYGSIAFNGPYGWNVWPLEQQQQPPEPEATNRGNTESKTNTTERIGFSFEMLRQPQQPNEDRANSDDSIANKRARHF